MLRSPVDSLACALFPSPCAYCGNPLLRLHRAPVCDFCWYSLSPQQGVLCARCGEDLGVASFSMPRLAPGDPRNEQLCQPCRLAPPAFSNAAAYGVYQGPLRGFIHLLKYDGMRPIAGRLGKLLAGTLRTAPEFDAAAQPRRIVVVPVPMHRAKRRSRGFNHATLLAEAVAAEMRRTHSAWSFELDEGLLERRKATLSQAGLTPHQRRVNLRGAFFSPHPARIAGRHVLLVDDVFTTGATARACSRILSDAGAASIFVATAARAQREGVAFWDALYLRPRQEGG
ncbi:MAG TPA: ComF family protein [Acidobacteriaceae bacterium]|nr:ComF family protein [Acidobacteriaceae bacterium]